MTREKLRKALRETGWFVPERFHTVEERDRNHDLALDRAVETLAPLLAPSPAAGVAEASIEAAEQEVFRLCRGPNRAGGRSFRMTIPVEPTDSDIVLINGLQAGREAVDALYGLRAAIGGLPDLTLGLKGGVSRDAALALLPEER